MKRNRKTIEVFGCLLATLLILSACFRLPQPSQKEAITAGNSPVISEAALSPTSSALVSETVTPSPSALEQEEPVNTAKMYTSYAFMVSYDPARGWVDFDYFDMLRGDDAVKWLVEEKGYTEEEAQEEVDNYADSEFICKNTNSQLRTVDLKNVSLKLMYNPDGTMVDGSTPVDSTIDDFNTLYEFDSRLVLEQFFYQVIVKDGNVTSVEQIYWP